MQEGRRAEGVPLSPSTGSPPRIRIESSFLQLGVGIGCEAVPAKRAVNGSCGVQAW